MGNFKSFDHFGLKSSFGKFGSKHFSEMIFVFGSPKPMAKSPPWQWCFQKVTYGIIKRGRFERDYANIPKLHIKR